jgi:DNA-binding transcriptional ArsR family regulator
LGKRGDTVLYAAVSHTKHDKVGRRFNMNVQIFSALAEPNRLDIVNLLLDGPLPVGEIAEKLDLNQPQTSKHLRVLCDAGLVKVHPVANRRIYSLRPEPLQELDRWLDSYRRMWEARMDRLDDYLNVIQGKKPLN